MFAFAAAGGPRCIQAQHVPVISPSSRQNGHPLDVGCTHKGIVSYLARTLPRTLVVSFSKKIFLGNETVHGACERELFCLLRGAEHIVDTSTSVSDSDLYAANLQLSDGEVVIPSHSATRSLKRRQPFVLLLLVCNKQK